MAELTAGQLIIPNGAIVNEEQPMQSVPVSVDTDGTITSAGGRVVSTTRVTTTYTILVTDDNVFCDTDGGDFTVTLPALADGQKFRIVNAGSGTLTIAPDGTDLLIGANASTTMGTGVVVLTGETTEGWW
jgi:hypothetical protein